jgi:CheY-like chemotaxis protein
MKADMTPSAAPHNSRVLLVDDEPGILEFVDRTLRGAGYHTCTAASGAAALALAESAGPFDLLLTDVRMPGMTGDELARTMRRFYPDLKVLYLTGYSDQLFHQKGMLWTGEAFLDKPSSALGLLEAVSLLIRGRLTDGSTAEHRD